MMRKSLKVSPAAEPIRTFGGSPINVAVPPRLDRNASAISKGTGLILRFAATMMVTGASRRMTVALFRSMEMIAVSPPKMANSRTGLPSAFWAARIASASTAPVFRNMAMSVIMPRSKPRVLKSMEASACPCV